MSLVADIHKKLGAFSLDVALEAEEGITGLLGASGCGKSLTLKCIAGIERPDSGVIELDGEILFDSGKKIDLAPQKRGVGYLFQNYALFPNMTVRKNILCGLRPVKDRRERERELQGVIRLMRLEGLEDHLPAQLSGGQQQRAALARIIVTKPRLLLLDEPFSALDTHLRNTLKIELKDLLRSLGIRTLLVTHSRDEAYDLCTEIAVMDRGSISVRKPSRALFDDPEYVAAAVMTGCTNIAGAVKTGEKSVAVPDWGICLKTARKVPEDVRAVGIYARDFSPCETENRFRAVHCDTSEEPEETVFRFRFETQRPDTAPVWWRPGRTGGPETFPGELGVSPEKILLLKE